MSRHDKSAIVKDLAGQAKFAAIEEQFGSSACQKAKQWALNKIERVRRELKETGSKNEANLGPFIDFCVHCADEKNIDELLQAYISSSSPKSDSLSELSEVSHHHENEDDAEIKRLLGENVPTKDISKKRKHSKDNYQHVKNTRNKCIAKHEESFVVPEPSERLKYKGASDIQLTKRSLDLTPKPSPSADRVMQFHSRAGVKQVDLPPDLDMIALEYQPCLIEIPPAIGTRIAIIVPAYRDFIGNLPTSILQHIDVESVQQFSHISDCVVVAKVLQYSTIRGLSNDNVQIMDLSLDDGTFNHTEYRIVYIPQSSPLCDADRYILMHDEYCESLEKPLIAVGAEVRKAFASEDGEKLTWCEGIIYRIHKDMMTIPYKSIDVAWIVQEKGTLDWVYDYNQTDTELSDYKKSSPMILPILPPGKITGADILDCVIMLDAACIFCCSVVKHEEFCAMFSKLEDQIDLRVLQEKCKQGLYNDSDGIAQLLRDMFRMVRNAKVFNQCNAEFQPWRFADMFEAALETLHEQLRKLYTLPELHLLSGKPIVDENLTMQMCL